MNQQREHVDRLKATKTKTLVDAKRFADAAMQLEIDAVLQRAGRISKIGATAAHMAGESLLLVGDRISEGVINGAYMDVDKLMRPAVADLGAQRAVELFNKPGTYDTIQGLASVSNDHTISVILSGFSAKRKYLELTDDGLVRRPDFEFPDTKLNESDGCPMAARHRASYFNRFTARVIETYSAAYTQDMPLDKRDQIMRLFNS